MKIKPHVNVIAAGFSMLVFCLALVSCNSRPDGAGTSTSMRVWLDQPPDGYTLPLERFRLIAHARQPGGGVRLVRFMVNDILLGESTTDQTVELAEASLDWNPSTPGRYRIQAVSYNVGGAEAYSEIAVVCIEGSDSSGCPSTGELVISPSPIVEDLKVGASPETLRIGANCSATSASINFEAYVSDMTDVIEVDIHGRMINNTEETREIVFPLRDSGGGRFTGTYMFNADDLLFFSRSDGKIVYTVSLMNDRKEWFRNSAEKFIFIESCAAQGGNTIKVGGVPNPVYIGKCTRGEVTTIDFEAGTDVDPSTFNRVDLAYVWFDPDGTWVGSAVGTENRAAMTPESGGYWYHLSTGSAPGQLDFGGSIKFRAILVNASGIDVGFSDVSEIKIVSCSTAVKITPKVPTLTPTKFISQPQQPVQPQPVKPRPPVIITTEAPPPPEPPAPPPVEIKPGYIFGTVLYDSNGDGKCDSPWTFGGISVTAGSTKTGVSGDGSFNLGPLDPGSYTVILNHPGYNAIGADSVGVYVESGGTASAGFCLASPG